MNVRPLITTFSAEDWAFRSASVIQNSIHNILAEAKQCNVLLTGGNSATQIYKSWSQLSEFKILKNVNFYIGDERCVDFDHTDSNIGMVMKTLFADGIPHGCSIHPMPDSAEIYKNGIDFYTSFLPDQFDVTILGIGLDGHIASIFPLDISSMDEVQRVVRVKSLNHPHERLTVTPLVINTSRNLFLIAYGAQKANALLTTLKMDDPIKWPACLALRGEWLLDDELYSEIKKGLLA
jgi:6-phosphogluconolactonase